MAFDKDDDGVINLKQANDEPEFRINHIEEPEQNGAVARYNSGADLEGAAAPGDKVKVKFDKFVNLVATHAYEDIFEKHMDEDIIVSTDLLTDLANAHEEKADKKVPMIFITGIFLGILVTWILLKT